ncbi:MAG: rod shape-determining protein MreB [Burkholderiaceae bacterium]|jgi:rod shape-determining protein MreB
MLSALFPILYVKFDSDRLTVRNVRTGAEISEVPEIAMRKAGKKTVILASGVEARNAAFTQSAELINPFNHPRILLGDSILGQQLLKSFIHRLDRTWWFALTTRVVMHPTGFHTGSFTQAECRTFCEMALGAGASQVVLWLGRELSDQEVQSTATRHHEEGLQ